MVAYWDRLKPEMDANGLDIAGLAREIGVSYQAVKKVHDGGSFGLENNLKAAKRLGLSPEWLARGTGPKNADAVALGGPVEISMRENGDYPSIRRVSLKAQAGVTGYAVEFIDDDGPPIVFRKDWYTTNGYKRTIFMMRKVANKVQ
jgi:hypothetical protein